MTTKGNAYKCHISVLKGYAWCSTEIHKELQQYLFNKLQKYCFDLS